MEKPAYVWIHPDGYRAEGSLNGNKIRFTVTRLSWEPGKRITWTASTSAEVASLLTEWFGDGWRLAR